MDQPEVCAEVPRRVRRGPRVQAGRVVAAGREELSKRRGGGAHPHQGLVRHVLRRQVLDEAGGPVTAGRVGQRAPLLPG